MHYVPFRIKAYTEYKSHGQWQIRVWNTFYCLDDDMVCPINAVT